MLKILQARLQQYMNLELPDVQAGFRKGRGTRDQIVNICWIIEKAREYQKNIYFCFIDYAKPYDCMDHNKLENSSRNGNIRPPDLPPEKSVCRSRSNRTGHGTTDWFQIGTHGDPTSLAPHERLTDLAVVPREKPHTGAAAREQPRDSPVIER